MKRLMTLALVSAASSAVMAEGITWSGDFKYRYERNNQQKAPGDFKKFNQERLALKLGASATPVEGVKIEARLATGDGRTSVNQTVGESAVADAGKNYNFKLDRANLAYDVVEGLVLSVGRMGVKYNMVGGSDMLWDGDVNLDGLHLGHKMAFGEMELMGNIGSFQIIQAKTFAAPKESTLQAYQLAAKGGFGETKYTVSAALYNFDNYGNTIAPTTTVNGKALDYQIINPGLEVKLPISLPVTVFVDYSKNTAGNTDNKETAYMAGVKINSLKEAGSWMVSYDFREVEKYATAGIYADAESFYSGTTDGRGHRVKTGYQLNSAMSLAANYFSGKANIATTAVNYSRIQLDLNAKF